MKVQTTLTALFAAAGVIFAAEASAGAQTAPQIIWSAPNPSSLSTHVGAVAWSPNGGLVATGLGDRNVRIRNASNGSEVRAILQPIRSGGASQLAFSTDGQYLAVVNATGTANVRVYVVSTGAFLGQIVATQGANGIWKYAPDAQLQTSTGGDGTMSRWHFSDFFVASVTGSGYQRVSTVFNFSSAGLQTATSQGSVRVQRTSDGAQLATLAGDKVFFSADGSMLAAWTSSPNRIRIWRMSDWVLLGTLNTPSSAEGISALRFSPNGAQLISTGYYPYVDRDGLWQQIGIVRFWNVATRSIRVTYNRQTDLAVTSPVAFSPSTTSFLFGRYDGTTIAAIAP